MALAEGELMVTIGVMAGRVIEACEEGEILAGGPEAMDKWGLAIPFALPVEGAAVLRTILGGPCEGQLVVVVLDFVALWG